MKLIVGIGNPGERYKNTRHNTGFLVLEELKNQISNFHFPISSEFLNHSFQSNKKLGAEILRVGDLILAKPIIFMNNSGKAVSALAAFYKLLPSDVYVIHDDLDIPLGQYKIQLGVGPKVHNGINSINQALGSKDYWRVRVGIESRNRVVNGKLKMESYPDGEQYVLQNFTDEEKKILEAVIEKIVRELVSILQSLVSI